MKKLYIIFLTILAILSFNNLLPQQQEKELANIAPKLEIIKGEYGIINSTVHSGDHIALNCKDINCWLLGIMLGPRDYWGTINEYWGTINKKKFSPKGVFIIKRYKDEQKPGAPINYNDVVTLKHVLTNKYLGERSHHPYLQDQILEKNTQWEILNGTGSIKHRSGTIRLESQSENSKYDDDKQYLLRKSRSWNRGRIKGKADDDRIDFTVYRVYSNNNYNYTTPVVSTAKGKRSHAQILASLISNKDHLITDLSDGINQEINFDELFPIDPTPGLWKQLRVTYKLDRLTCEPKIFEQADKIIKLPTKDELIKAKRILKKRTDKTESLKKLGFQKASENYRLTKVSTGNGQTWGLNDKGEIFKWYNNKLLKAPDKAKEIAVFGDLVLIISPNNFLYKLIKKERKWEKVLNQKFTKVSIADKENVWLIDTEGKVSILNSKTNELTTVGQNIRLTEISAASDWTVFGIDKDQNVVRWDGGSDYELDEGWTTLTNINPIKINTGSEKYVYAINNHGKLYSFTGQDWEEIREGSGAVDIAADASGNIWLLIEETPGLPGGHAIYYKTRNVYVYGDTIALQAYHKKFVTVEPDRELKAITGWPITINESVTIVSPEDETGPLHYQQEIALRSVDDTYLTVDEEGNLSATETEITDNSKFKLINEADPESEDEIAKDSEAAVNIESITTGLQLGSKRKRGQIFADDKQGGLTKRWRIFEGK